MAEKLVPFGEIVFDAQRGTLSKSGKPLNVSERANTLLAALIEADGQVVSKQDLMAKAWPSMIVEEGNLTVQIAALRKALGSDAAGNDWIVTVPRVGYRLLIPLVAAVATSEHIVLPSLAVLPFANLSGDPEQDYFADGVVEDIITALSRFKSFAVIARNSSFTYKGHTVDVRQVGKDLGVRYILEGSVRRTGNRLRVSAQLVDSSSGANLWAQKFEGDHAEVFEFQDHITESVAMIVEPQIRQAEIERSRRDRPGSLTAYDLYLRTLPVFRALTPSENAAAYSLISQALALEPNNSLFVAQAMHVLNLRGVMGWPPLLGNDKTVLRDLANRVLANGRDDALALAHCAATLVHSLREYELGAATSRRAFDLNPNNYYAAFVAGVVNLHCGSLDDALACFQRAIRLSPSDPELDYALAGIAHLKIVSGDYVEALAFAERALEYSSTNNFTHWMLIAANALLGRLDEAQRWLEKFRAIAPGVTIASIRSGQPNKDPHRLAAILEGLRLAGLPEA